MITSLHRCKNREEGHASRGIRIKLTLREIKFAEKINPSFRAPHGLFANRHLRYQRAHPVDFARNTPAAEAYCGDKAMPTILLQSHP